MSLKVTLQQFVERSLKLLDKERDAEIEETRSLTEKLPAKELQRRGVCLLKLHIANRKTGLYGRTVLVLEPGQDTLPSHSITPGDIVGLSPSSSLGESESLGSGIVTHVNQSSLSVAFDESHDLFSLDDGVSDLYKVTKLANDVTYRRLKRTLNNLDKSVQGDNAHLIDVLFGQQELSSPNHLQELRFQNDNLNESQKEAVKFAISQKEIAIVHGPPGTGKTTTVVEIILQLVQQKNKVLACAPSNIAVDNLVERLARSKHKIVRLGHPARLLPHIQKYSLDAILSTSDETKLVEDVRKDLDKALGKLKRSNERGERQKYREEMKFLRKELRQRTDTATREILKRAEVVLVTLTSATDDGPMKLLEENHFDTVIIDEVSQAMEAACWIPLLRTRKCILAGDHLQLPPTILSKEAAKEGLGVTLMERLLDLYGDDVMKMLTTQYRMNEKIMNWSSEQLYESKLVAHDCVKFHLLCDIPEIKSDEVTSVPLLYIDTAGCDMRELELPEEISKGNEGEADIVSIHVRKLIDHGIKQEDIAVIAPYNLQVELIRWRLAKDFPKVEIKSVDGFQGREKEAVIISLVRSNPKGEVGFLSEKRRINVAVTRARRHLAVIGDSETVSKDGFLKSLIDYMNHNGEVETAQVYINDDEFGSVASSRPDHLTDLMTVTKGNKDKGARPKVPKAPTQKETKKSEKKQSVQITHDKENRDISVCSIEENLPKVTEFQAQLDNFLQDGDAATLEFPASLTSHDRLILHELAEKLGLVHNSKGTGAERHIIILKPGSRKSTKQSFSMSNKAAAKQEDNFKDTKDNPVHEKKHSDNIKMHEEESKCDTKNTCNETNTNSTSNQSTIDVNETETNTTNKPVPAPKNDNMVTCKTCGRDVIKANIHLHEIHCARRGAQGEQNAGKQNEKKKKKKNASVSKSAQSRQFDKELATKVNNVDKDDFDALIDVVQKMDSSCCFKKCKTSVQTLFNVCMYCNGRYCMSHHIPEVHGCGDAARAQARSQIIRDGVLHRGSGVPNKRPDSAKKVHLQRKLDSKLTELSSKRKTKPKK